MIRVTQFRGMAPRVSARLLEAHQARLARNCRLTSGDLESLHEPAFVATPAKAGTVRSLHLFGRAHWFHWTEAGVSVVRGPIAGDTLERTYWTGDGFPKVTSNEIATAGGGEAYPATHYRLGIPEPLDAPTATPADPASGSITDIVSQDGVLVIHSAAHGRETGDEVLIEDVFSEDAPDPNVDDLTPMAEALNGNPFTVTVIDEDTFSLDQVDSDSLTAYVSSGTWAVYYDPGYAEPRSYVVTYVSGWGEEGPPSPPSGVVLVGRGQGCVVSGVAPPPSGPFNIITKRLYRANRGTQATEFQLVAELDAAAESFLDTKGDDELAEVLPSADWDPPPDGLQGLTALPNGVLAGFEGMDIYLCEPYMPHAWPEPYRLTANWTVVGLAVFGTSIAVLTEGNPYLVTGTDPSSMGMTHLEINQACVSRRGIASLGMEGVVYPSPDGLVLIGNGGARLLTEPYLTRREWQAYNPASIHAYAHDGQYIAFYDAGEGQRGGFIFDPREGGLTEIDIYATGGYVDLLNDALYLVVDGEIVQWDAGAGLLPRAWASKEFVFPAPVNLGAARVRAAGYDDLVLQVYADGVLRHTQSVADERPFRLPAGFLGRVWSLRIEGTERVHEVALAPNPDRLEA